MKNAIEGKFASGARPINPLRRKVKKLLRQKVAKGFSFDWTKGYDVRDTIGQIKIKNQGTNFSCGGQSGSYFIYVQRQLQGIKEGEVSAKSIYSPIVYPGGGTTIDMLEKQIAGAGANLENDVKSYDAYGNPQPEYMISDKSWITPSLMIDALKRAGYVPYDIKDDIDSVANAIEVYGAIIWEIVGQNNGTWLSAYPQPPVKTNKNEKWHHFMCGIGAKMINGKKTIIALQSMGEEYGDHGIQYFTEDYFNSGYIADAFTFIYGKNINPDINNTSFFANVIRWFRTFYWKI